MAQQCLKNGKAPGLDGIRNEKLRQPGLCELLTKLFYLCLDGGKIPDIWRTVMINPIPKGKDKDKNMTRLNIEVSHY